MGDLSDSVVGLIDSLRKLLSTLPANPVSEFLSGALYLGRRILKPVGSGVGLFGTVACVATTDCSGQDLTNADLSARILTALDFSGAVLNGVDFSGADLSRADLSMAQLHAANLTDANLLEANLVGADLVGADLDGVTNFGTALLTGANLSGQILIRLDLSGKDLTGTDFVGAILTGTDLSDTELGQANFQGAGLAGVNLSGADLSTVNLSLADLSGAVWGDTPCPSGVDCSPVADAIAADTGVGVVDAGSTGSVDQGLAVSDPSIATNLNFSYEDAILAARFSELAYKHRENNFKALVDATGWLGIRVPDAMVGPGGSSPEGGGYGVIGTQDGMDVNSYAFAGSRVAGDGTVQFVFAVEGSNSCPLNCLLGYPGPGEERQDWDANFRKFGWSRYYASLQPLMAEVLRQMVDNQKKGKKVQLIITGHSLGGAVAMIAYADLIPMVGDLYPLDQTDVLSQGKRIWDKYAEAIGSRSFSLSDTWRAVKDAITVYTFGAPSPLIEWLKFPEGLSASVENIKRDGISAFFGLLAGLPVPVDERWPLAFRNSDMTNRIFQFEHKGEGDYLNDVVANFGSRDPGYRFEIKLRPDVQDGYAGNSYIAKLNPAATHSMGLYSESLIRLVTWDALLANSTPVESVVGLRTPRGNGVDGRNDVFREMIPNCSSKQECEFIGYTPSQGDSKNNVGRSGNDWYAPALGRSYLVDGGAGSDLYALYKNSIGQVTIDGRSQSGTDGIVFYGGLEASDIKVERNQRSQSVDVTFTSKAQNSYTTLLIKNWDRWAPTDVFYTKNVDGRLTLARLPNVKVGPSS